jgi:hypothetical protein
VTGDVVTGDVVTGDVVTGDVVTGDVVTGDVVIVGSDERDLRLELGTSGKDASQFTERVCCDRVWGHSPAGPVAVVVGPGLGPGQLRSTTPRSMVRKVPLQ